MKIAYKEFENTIQIIKGAVNTLIIENPNLLRTFLLDIKNQLDGNSGEVILSKENVILNVAKDLEIITDVLMFDLNKKSLLNKIYSCLNSVAISSKFYIESQNIISKIENYIYDLCDEFTCGLSLSKISIASIIKMAGIVIDDHYENDLEKILDYMLLVREFDKDKLFIIVGTRNYFDDHLIQEFFNSVVSHELNVLMIETYEKEKLLFEKRMIIDIDRCEIF